MRKIKGSSSYLKTQVRKNFAKAAIFTVIFSFVSVVLIFRLLSTLQFGFLEQTALAASLVSLVIAYFYLRRYRVYRGGWEGEKQVAKLLNSKLNDDYYLINHLYLQGGGGDIDHAVFGPNGVFVLETKNWSGKISCNGDEWRRFGKPNFSASPSHQVKRNAQKIKQAIDVSSDLRALKVEVEGIVVLTNLHATLHLNNVTVPVLRLPKLPSHIVNHGPSVYSHEQLEAMIEQVLMRKR